MKRIHFILIGVVLAAAVFFLSGRTKINAQTNDERFAAPLTSAAQALPKTVPAMEIFGQISQDPKTVIDVFSPESGTVIEVKGRLDQLVYPDTPLAEVKTSEGHLVEVLAKHHGIIFTKFIKKGDLIDNTFPLMSIADMDHLKATFDIYEKDLAQIKLGQRLAVTCMAYPHLKFKGKIVFIAPQVDSETGTTKIRAEVENQEHQLRYGMFVSAQVLSSDAREEPPISAEEMEEDRVSDSKKEKAPTMMVLKAALDDTGILRAEQVATQPLNIYLDVLGNVASDSELSVPVTASTAGTVKTVNVTTGNSVEKGQPLLIYQDSEGLKTLSSDDSGVVISVNVAAGDAVTPKTPLILLSDTSAMKIIFDVYESQIQHVHLGQAVVVRTAAFPGASFEGKVESISPRVDENTRSIKVTVIVANPHGLLKYGLFVSGQIKIESRQARVVSSTAIQEMEGKKVVFLSHDQSHYFPQVVELGKESEGKVEISGGVKDGDYVISHGGLLVKAEWNSAEKS